MKLIKRTAYLEELKELLHFLQRTGNELQDGYHSSGSTNRLDHNRGRTGSIVDRVMRWVVVSDLSKTLTLLAKLRLTSKHAEEVDAGG